MFGVSSGQEREEGKYDENNRETHYTTITTEGKVRWFSLVLLVLQPDIGLLLNLPKVGPA